MSEKPINSAGGGDDKDKKPGDEKEKKSTPASPFGSRPPGPPGSSVFGSRSPTGSQPKPNEPPKPSPFASKSPTGPFSPSKPAEPAKPSPFGAKPGSEPAKSSTGIFGKPADGEKKDDGKPASSPFGRSGSTGSGGTGGTGPFGGNKPSEPKKDDAARPGDRKEESKPARGSGSGGGLFSRFGGSKPAEPEKKDEKKDPPKPPEKEQKEPPKPGEKKEENKPAGGSGGGLFGRFGGGGSKSPEPKKDEPKGTSSASSATGASKPADRAGDKKEEPKPAGSAGSGLFGRFGGSNKPPEPKKDEPKGTSSASGATGASKPADKPGEKKEEPKPAGGGLFGRFTGGGKPAEPEKKDGKQEPPKPAAPLPKVGTPGAPPAASAASKPADKPGDKKEEPKQAGGLGNMFSRLSRQEQAKPAPKPGEKPAAPKIPSTPSAPAAKTDDKPGGVGGFLSRLRPGGGNQAAQAPAKPDEKRTTGQAALIKPPPGAAPALKSPAVPQKSVVVPPARLEKQAKPLESLTQVTVKNRGLSLDQKLDLIGYALLISGLVIVFGLAQPDQGTFTTAIVNVLGAFFGYARYFVPLPCFLIGGWLLVRHFKENPLLELDFLRIVGLVLGFITLAVTLHFFELLLKEVYTWQELAAVSQAAADAQRGGGWVGDRLYYGLISVFGEWGIAVVLLALWIISIMLVFEITLAEVSAYMKSVYTYIARVFGAARGRRRTWVNKRVQVRQARTQAKAAQAAAQLNTPLTIEKAQPAMQGQPVAAIPASAALGSHEAPALAPAIEKRGMPQTTAQPAPMAEAAASVPVALGSTRQAAPPAPTLGRTTTAPTNPPVPEETPPPVPPIARATPMPISGRPVSTPVTPKPERAADAEPPRVTSPDAIANGGEKPAAPGTPSVVKPTPFKAFGKPSDKAADKPADQPAEAKREAPPPPTSVAESSRMMAASPATPAEAKAEPKPEPVAEKPAEAAPDSVPEPVVGTQSVPPPQPVSPSAFGPAKSGGLFGNRPKSEPAKSEPKQDGAKATPQESAAAEPPRSSPFAPAKPASLFASKSPTKPEAEDKADQPADTPDKPEVKEPPAEVPLPKPTSLFGAKPGDKPAAKDAPKEPPTPAPSRTSPFGAAKPGPFGSKPTAGASEAKPAQPAEAKAEPSDEANEPNKPIDMKPPTPRPGLFGNKPAAGGGPFSTFKPAPKPGAAPKPESKPTSDADDEDDLKYEAEDDAPPTPARADSPKFTPARPAPLGASPASHPPAASAASPAPAIRPAEPQPEDDEEGELVPAAPSERLKPIINMPHLSKPADATPAVPVRVKSETGWDMPNFVALLEAGSQQNVQREFLEERAGIIEETLRSFGSPGRVVEINPGPVITQFGVEPDYLVSRQGKRTRVKVSAIAKLDADLALALAARSIRIEAPVPGKGYVGIEVPNGETALVGLRDIMADEAFRKLKSRLRIALGKSIDGAPVVADLTAMPHLLIAGTTGSGKSVCVNAIIASLLLENSPDELKFIMVDPKRVELTGYNGIPHLVSPVVVDLERIVGVLKWVTREMDERYKKFSAISARNILDYNGKQNSPEQRMPYLVVVIDELADLMMLAPDETERVLTRLAQMARATGIHLIISTQRPSVDVVTGLIKANFPARISFAVASSVDSRVILDQPGAEKLLGRGDMLYQAPDAAAPLRAQGVYVSDAEINRITKFWKETHKSNGKTTPPVSFDHAPDRPSAKLGKDGGEPFTPRANRLGNVSVSGSAASPGQSTFNEAITREPQTEGGDDDEMYEEAVALFKQMNKISITLLQRRLRLGFTRAARLIELMKQRGVLGASDVADSSDGAGEE